MPRGRGIGWDDILEQQIKVWPDKRSVKGEKNIGVKGREGSFQEKQQSTGFIGSADDIFFSTESGVEDHSQVFAGGDC